MGSNEIVRLGILIHQNIFKRNSTGENLLGEPLSHKDDQSKKKAWWPFSHKNCMKRNFLEMIYGNCFLPVLAFLSE